MMMIKFIYPLLATLLLTACAGQMSHIKKTQPKHKYDNVYIEAITSESSKLKVTKNKSALDNWIQEPLRLSNIEFMHRIQSEIPTELKALYTTNNITIATEKSSADLIFTLKTPKTLEAMCEIFWCATRVDTDFSLTDRKTGEILYSGKVLVSSGVYWDSEYAKKKAIKNGESEKDLSLEIANKFFNDTKSFF